MNIFKTKRKPMATYKEPSLTFKRSILSTDSYAEKAEREMRIFSDNLSKHFGGDV